jgi:o-succinylbenzoate---CoA ligase
MNTAAFWQGHDRYGLSADAPLQAAPAGSILVQTSGSEGAAKWVVLTRQAFLVSAQAVNAHLQTTARDRWLIALPTHHVGGFAIYARAYVAGCPVHHFTARWNAQSFVQSCAEQHITLTSLVPTQVVDLVRAGLRCPPSVRAIVVGGASLAMEIGVQARALGWPVLQSYGMSETASQVATEPLSHLLTGYAPHAMQVLPQWQATVDSQQRLSVSGDALASGYLVQGEDREWVWQPIMQPFATRDLASLSAGCLHYLARESNMLKIMGELVALQPLQDRVDSLSLELALHGRSVLHGIADERTGQTIELITECTDARSLVDRFNAGVRPFERITCMQHVPALAVSELGKVRLPRS